MRSLTTKSTKSSASAATTTPSSNNNDSNNNNNNDSNNNNNNSNSSSSSSNWWIRLGWTLMGLVVIDQALQLKQQWEDQDKHAILQEMQLQANAADVNQVDFDATLPTLFECKLLHVEPSLDGTKMLTRQHPHISLREGDVVEVIQANVGHNQAYHLCRVKSKKQNYNHQPQQQQQDAAPPLVGWYPVMFLERVS
jgi:hypothetical protein